MPNRPGCASVVRQASFPMPVSIARCKSMVSLSQRLGIRCPKRRPLRHNFLVRQRTGRRACFAFRETFPRFAMVGRAAERLHLNSRRPAVSAGVVPHHSERAPCASRYTSLAGALPAAKRRGSSRSAGMTSSSMRCGQSALLRRTRPTASRSLSARTRSRAPNRQTRMACSRRRCEFLAR